MLALLEADPALTVEDSAQVDDQGQLKRAQYVILYPTGPDELEDNRWTKAQELESTATITYELQAVSRTALGCADVADHVLVALVGKVPVVDGRTIDPIRYVEMSDVQPDFGSTPALYFSRITVFVTSRRA